MMLLRFTQVRKERVYDATHPSINGLTFQWESEGFFWKQLDDYVYELDASDLGPGEYGFIYGFIFRFSSITSYKFDAAYTFGGLSNSSRADQ